MQQYEKGAWNRLKKMAHLQKQKKRVRKRGLKNFGLDNFELRIKKH